MSAATYADAAAEIDAAGRPGLNRYTLRFADAAQEAGYREARRPAEVRYARGVLVFVFLLTLAVVPLDLRIFAGDRIALLFLGHGLELTVIATLFGLSFVAYFRTRYTLLMSALAVFFAAIYAVWSALFAAPDIYVAGGTLMIVAIYLLLPFDFVDGATTGVGCSALFLAIIGLAHPMRGLPYLTLAFFMGTANAIGAVSLYHIERLRRLEYANLREIDRQRGRYRDLLVRILPRSIAERLQRGEAGIADRFEEATVLFADLVGFTALARHHSPEEVVTFLDRVFAVFDRLVEKHGAEKIKTIGDAYMVASGVPAARADHAQIIADLALDMVDSVHAIQTLEGRSAEIRIGISSGPIVAGVIGDTRFGYDLWGDTVNVASRMESHGVPGSIQVSDEVSRRLMASHVLERRGEVEIKGLGAVATWVLRGRKPGG